MSVIAMKLALDALEYEAKRGGDGAYLLEREALRQAILEAKKPEVLEHKHEWFRTGEMEVNQYRCISCGKWGKENV